MAEQEEPGEEAEVLDVQQLLVKQRLQVGRRLLVERLQVVRLQVVLLLAKRLKVGLRRLQMERLLEVKLVNHLSGCFCSMDDRRVSRGERRIFQIERHRMLAAGLRRDLSR